MSFPAVPLALHKQAITMITFTAHLIKIFLPLVLMVGFLAGIRQSPHSKKTAGFLAWGVGCGLAAGTVAYSLAGSCMLVTEYLTVLSGINILVVAATAIAAFFLSFEARTFRLAAAAVFFLFGLSSAALAGFLFAKFSAEQALTTTVVLNTQFILNLGALLAGGLVLISLFFVVAHLTRVNGRTFSLLSFAAIGVFPLLTGTAEVLLGLMRLEVVEMTGPRLSFAGKAVGFAYLYPYLQLAIFTVTAIVFYLKRPVYSSKKVRGLNRAGKRKELAGALFELRFFKAAVLLLCLSAGPLLYYDLYASRPPSLSEAKSVVVDQDNMARIPVEEVKDGKLHRFSYITGEGRKVRFFLINRYEDHISIGAVFDACIICGDMGYIQVDNEVICIACNVRMFTPSIGKPGGCNPIPMKHEIRNGHVLINVSELEQGARHFSEIVELEVKDPVTGADLTNLDATRQFSYQGKPYFFEGVESFEKFKASPETYLSPKKFSGNEEE